MNGKDARGAELEETEENRSRVKLMMARCYEALKKTEDSLALYNEVVAGNDPFWSNVAKERIEEIAFHKELKEEGAGLKNMR